MWSGHSCPLPLSLFDEGTTPSADGTNGKGTTSVHVGTAALGCPVERSSTTSEGSRVGLRAVFSARWGAPSFAFFAKGGRGCSRGRWPYLQFRRPRRVDQNKPRLAAGVGTEAAPRPLLGLEHQAGGPSIPPAVWTWVPHPSRSLRRVGGDAHAAGGRTFNFADPGALTRTNPGSP
jgi:hypothetical protein